MIRKNQGLINLINMLSDALITMLSYFFVLMLRFEVLGGRKSLHLEGGIYVMAMLAYSLMMVGTYHLLHVYSPQRLNRLGANNLRILLANTIGTMGLMTVLFVFRIVDVSRLAIFLFWLTTSALVIVKHMTLHGVLRYIRSKGYNLKHFLLVGGGKLARQYAEDIRKAPFLGIVIDGYVNDCEVETLGRRMGSYDELEGILQEHNFDGLVIAVEPTEVQHIQCILEAADKEGMYVQMVPLFSDFYPAHPTFDLIGGTKLINLRAMPLDRLGNSFIKRTMDIAGSLVLLILTSPIMLAVAIGVKLSSPGPVIFTQERIGRDKKPFNMHKFRSMRIDVPHDGWTTNNDPRKTRFGAFIRKYSLDELPQLFDVLIGKMSLVGPRPEIPRFVRQFKEEVPLYLVRQQVRPGMTGWAQVHGLRGDTSIEERVKYDIWYIENWSLSLDILILFKTAFGGMVNQETAPKAEQKENGIGEGENVVCEDQEQEEQRVS